MLIFHRLKDVSLELFPDLKKYSDDITTIDALKWDPRNKYALLMMGRGGVQIATE